MTTSENITIGGACIEAFEWAWKAFGKDVLKKSSDKFQEKWVGFKLERSAKDYLTDMAREYGTMKVLGMSGPVSLEGIFTEVNILKRASAFSRAREEQITEIFLRNAGFGDIREDGKGRDGLGVVRENGKLFILGKPGAGKTTFLKYLTLQAVKGELDKVPVFVGLRDFAESRKFKSDNPLFDFIVERFAICNLPDAAPFIKTLLKQGKAMVLCDGLDEVNKEGGVRDRVIRELTDFSSKYDKNKFVITCRIAASDYSFEKFTYVEMADFNEEQIKVMVGKWFKGDEKTVELFFKEFEQNERLKELAQNPLLLTLLCISFEATMTFSDRRSEIYEEALDALLVKWDSSRRIKRDDIYKRLSLGRKRNMFARIAGESFEKSEHVFQKKRLGKRIVHYLKKLPDAEKNDDIDGELVLKAIEAQHGIFVERAKNLYTFSHLTFQEYFTAKYVVDNMQKGSVEGLIKSHLFDGKWREIFLLTAEMIDDADRFFEVFAGALDDYVKKNKRIKRLLVKVGHEAGKMDEEPLKSRVVVLAIILDTSYYLARALALALDLALARALALDLDLALARALALDLDLDLDRALDLDLDLARDLALALDRARDLALALALDRARDRESLKIYDKIIALTERKSKVKLHKALKKVKRPSEKFSAEEWGKFADDLLKVFKEHFPIQDYEFTREEADSLAKYLNAVKLFGHCLKNAYVSDRDGLKNRLLRVPD